MRGKVLIETWFVISVDRVGEVFSKADLSVLLAPANVISISPECKCRGELILSQYKEVRSTDVC